MAGQSDKINQDDIEELLRQAQAAAGRSFSAPSGGTPQAASPELGAESFVGSGPSPAAAAAGSRTAAIVAPAPPPPPRQAASNHRRGGDDIQLLLSQAEQALASADQPVDPAIAGISPFQFPEFSGSPPSSEKATLELLRDVELDLRIELGRTEMYLEDVLKLRRGAVVSLDKLAGDPVDIYVNGRLIGRGEVLVLNDNFCVRVAELLTGEEAA
jgi:flagellar motor switch protein FliN/FliY